MTTRSMFGRFYAVQSRGQTVALLDDEGIADDVARSYPDATVKPVRVSCELQEVQTARVVRGLFGGGEDLRPALAESIKRAAMLRARKGEG